MNDKHSNLQILYALKDIRDEDLLARIFNLFGHIVQIVPTIIWPQT